MDQIKTTILDYVRTQYIEDRPEQVNADTPLISSGLVDSFSMVTLLRFIETHYQISIPDREATVEAFDTVTRIATLVERHIPNGQAG